MIILYDIDVNNVDKRDCREIYRFYSELNTNLCVSLVDCLIEMKIEGIQREKLIIYINFLAVKDVKTAEHSIRVAILGKRIASELQIDPKALIYSGLLHDMGKTLVPAEVLKKKGNFNKDDMEIMKDHPLNTFKLIGDIFGFSAQIGLRHHKHQENSYPEILPLDKDALSQDDRDNVEFYSKILSIADFFDAAVSRTRSMSEKHRMLAADEAIELMKEQSHDKVYLIDCLNSKDIFNNHMKLL